MWSTQIKKAKLKDIESIKHIANQYKQELGFLNAGKIRQSVVNGYCHVADSEGEIIGFVIYYSRKDSWNTIYDIAVDKDHTRKGVGRMLVNSVPSPIQLKCTVDNPANSFYASLGFKLVRTEDGRKRRLNIWKRRYLFIICKGSFKYLSELPLYEIGLEYGTRHSEKPKYQPFMVDIDWKKYDWNEYLHKISLWKPTFALVPDYESEKQRKKLYNCIRDLKNLGVLRIGVCPKFSGAIKHVPSFCIVCISIPSTYAGFIPNKDEVNGKRLHMLGGSPQKQIKYIQLYDNAITVSVDGNGFTKAAQWKTVYDGTRNKWINNNYLLDMHYGYVQAMQLSMYSIAHRFYAMQEYN